MRASHRGIQFELREIAAGRWRWAFFPPQGKPREGRVNGDMRWAETVAIRGIDIWHLMNRGDQAQAA